MRSSSNFSPVCPTPRRHIGTRLLKRLFALPIEDVAEEDGSLLMTYMLRPQASICQQQDLVATCVLFSNFKLRTVSWLLLLAGTFEGTLYLTIRNSYMIFGINYTTQCHQQHIEKCHTHLVSLIKHHGLFVPYNVTNFTVSFYSFNS